jgi:hypothetical protein
VIILDGFEENLNGGKMYSFLSMVAGQRVVRLRHEGRRRYLLPVQSVASSSAYISMTLPLVL